MENIKRQVYKIDAANKAVGRLATEITILLRGKNKASYEPRIDNGGSVEVSNIDKLKFTGKKLEQKKYYHYSGYPGGLKTIKMKDLKKKNPKDILVRAVKQMLPASRSRNGIMKRLKIK